MKKSRAKTQAALTRTQEKYDALAGEIAQLEKSLQKRYHKRSRLESRVGALLARSYPCPEPGGAGRQHACLILNPGSGPDEDNGDQLGAILRSLEACEISADIHLKLSDEYVKRIARQAAARQEPLVIVAAGDDTLEQVAGELVGSQTTLGILPMGTMNNLARSLGILATIEPACELLRAGTVERIDVGWICHEQSSGEYFLETAGAGLSAIAESAHAKGRGPGSSLPEALRDFDDHAKGELTVELDDGRVLRSGSGIVTVANAPLMGGHVPVAPGARLNDGLFDVAIYEDMTRRDIIEYLSGTSSKRRHAPKVTCYQAAHVRIMTAAEADGEAANAEQPLRRRDLELRVIPSALHVMAGRSPALGNLGAVLFQRDAMPRGDFD